MCARLLLLLLLTSLLIELRFAQNPTQCLLPNHTMAPCGPGNEQCGPPFLHAPQFHIRGLSCGLNDPNAPVFDQKHGIYHLFYQNHVAEPMGPNGVTWAHVVSRDLVHWARLATTFWNDQSYDKVAIYTGSATVVDGVITIMYPGLCTKELWPPCATGYNLVTAVPANASADPLLRNWTKLGVVFNNSDKDPSTAWRTEAGEWRVVTGGNDQDHDPMVMGSMDFSSWYEIGVQPGWDGGDCPSFFKLPRPTPGSNSNRDCSSGRNNKRNSAPTHVHMVGGGWMSLGQYTANGRGMNATWVAADPATHRKADWGSYYATKDFYDPVKKRRLLWGWVVNAGPSFVDPEGDRPAFASAQSLPREVTWHAALQQLVFAPLPEQNQLRGDSLADLSNKSLAAGAELSLGAFPGSSGNQSEVEVVFDIPSVSATFGVIVMGGASTANSPTGGTGTLFYVNYSPAEGSKVDEWAPNTVQVGAAPASMLKQLERGDKVAGGTTDTLKLSPNDKTITIRVYVDNTFCEAFWQDGRVAMTITTNATSQASMAVRSTAAVTLVTAKAYKVQSIWVSPEQVLATPRLDVKPITGRESMDE